MFNLSKIFNKKLSGKLLGVKASYSISFINSQMDWYEIPILKRMAKKSHPTVDILVGIPASYGQTRSDVVLRVFVSPTSDDVANDFKGFQEDNFLVSKNIDELLLPIIAEYDIKTLGYKISKADNIFIGDPKIKVLRITGGKENGLMPASFSETVFVFSPAFLLIFDLTLMDKDEPKASIIKADFLKILDSIKII